LTVFERKKNHALKSQGKNYGESIHYQPNHIVLFLFTEQGNKMEWINVAIINVP
jgi:hypothetical protein